MKMPSLARRDLARNLVVFAAGIMVAALIIPTLTNAQRAKDYAYQQLNLFGDVFHHVRQNYVEPIDDAELIETAITGMLTSLDPHSAFLNTDDFSDVKEQIQGRFGGLGVEITMEDGLIKVISPIDDTPAANAGIEPGDFLIAVDDFSIIGLHMSEAVEKLRGEVGSQVTIKVQRGQLEPFDVDIIRDFIKIRSVRSEIFDSIGYVRITTFSEQTTPGLLQAVDGFYDAEGNGLKGVVLDLRNNAGGLLNEAVSVSDAFLEKGEIVSTRSRTPLGNTHIYAKEGDIIDGLPLVVLINSGSASASEIVAGALKDHKRAVILGTRSFGKGSVQSVIPVNNTSAIRLTTARYYTPSGVSIQAKGIEPDIEVALARIETLVGGVVREEDLRGALDSNNEEDDGADAQDGEETDEDAVDDEAGEGDASDDDSAEADFPDQSEIDYQLARALDLIRGASVFGQSRSNDES